MFTKHLPTTDYLRQCFRYDSGKLFWLPRPLSHFSTKRSYSIWNIRFPGKEAGYLCRKPGDNRWLVRVNVTTYYRSRIVWVLHHGKDALGLIDHENRDSTDDRIDNLRVATFSQNNANSTIRADNISGFKGVSWHKANKKWVAGIRVNGIRIYLGSFTDPEVAHAACVVAAEKHFGKFANVG